MHDRTSVRVGVDNCMTTRATFSHKSNPRIYLRFVYNGLNLQVERSPRCFVINYGTDKQVRTNKLHVSMHLANRMAVNVVLRLESSVQSIRLHGKQ